MRRAFTVSKGQGGPGLTSPLNSTYDFNDAPTAYTIPSYPGLLSRCPPQPTTYAIHLTLPLPTTYYSLRYSFTIPLFPKPDTITISRCPFPLPIPLYCMALSLTLIVYVQSLSTVLQHLRLKHRKMLRNYIDVGLFNRLVFHKMHSNGSLDFR